MDMITLTSSCKAANLSKTLSYESNDNKNHDASFSSYLKRDEENFVRKTAESNQNMSPVIASQEERHYLGRKKEEEEIGVFSAEKYFNGAMDDSPRLPKVATKKCNYYVKDDHVKVAPVKTKVQSGVKVAPVKTKVQSGTHSVRSDSSSNSQSTLLQSALRNPSRKRANKVQGKSFFAGLRCKCSCSDYDSVDIDEHIGETSFQKTANCSTVQGKAITKEPVKPSSHHLIETVHIDKSGLAKEDLVLNEESCFSFPTMNSTTGTIPIKLHVKEGKEGEIKSRKSPEVFGFPVMEKKNKSSILESWDSAPGLEDIEFSATPGESYYEDYMSDASSDLFEIENLTGKANPFLARQGSDVTSDCATQTAYAPSEGSIEWSVVTASAADYSVMSDYEELRPPPTTATSPVRPLFSVTSNGRTGIMKEIPNRHPSISLGCKSQKAVRTAGEPYRTIEKPNDYYDPRIHSLSESFTPVTRFQAEASY